MRIEILVPRLRPDNSGNLVTARRYSALLAELGHQPNITHELTEASADLVVALNAYRSSEAVTEYHGAGRVIVILTGTDVYRFLSSEPERVLECLARADRLVALNDRVGESIPAEFHGKLQTIYQSADRIERCAANKHVFGTADDLFHVISVGHLRDEKNPLLAAYAASELPAESRIHVHLYGDAFDDDWRQRTTAASEKNPRFTWHGPVTPQHLGTVYSAADLLVISSRIEGGANVVAEAAMADLPVIASEIPGNLGMLGPNYEAYFAEGNTAALAELMHRCESEPQFVARLESQIRARQQFFSASRERDAWQHLIQQVESDN